MSQSRFTLQRFLAKKPIRPTFGSVVPKKAVKKAEFLRVAEETLLYENPGPFIFRLATATAFLQLAFFLQFAGNGRLDS